MYRLRENSKFLEVDRSLLVSERGALRPLQPPKSDSLTDMPVWQKQNSLLLCLIYSKGYLHFWKLAGSNTHICSSVFPPSDYLQTIRPELPSALLFAEGKRDTDFLAEAENDFSPPEFHQVTSSASRYMLATVESLAKAVHSSPRIDTPSAAHPPHILPSMIYKAILKMSFPILDKAKRALYNDWHNSDGYAFLLIILMTCTLWKGSLRRKVCSCCGPGYSY